jgi:ubiquinone/menaquinone biosynthesis C-methylase UbiE
MSYPEYPAFTEIAPHYDALMHGVPYRQWARYLDRLLAHRRAKPRRILDLACGTGNVTELLAARGGEVVGVDLSEPMIAMARAKAEKKGLSIRYYAQDAAEMHLPGLPFDLCVSFFDSLNYIHVPVQLESAIERVFAHLAPGGLFIFDINSEFALKNGFFDQENTYSNDRLRYVWRSEYDDQTRLCHVHMRFFLRERNGVDREFRETHVQFAYGEGELRDMLLRAGFGQIETFHAYTFRAVGPTTDRIFFIAQRPG